VESGVDARTPRDPEYDVNYLHTALAHASSFRQLRFAQFPLVGVGRHTFHAQLSSRELACGALQGTRTHTHTHARARARAHARTHQDKLDAPLRFHETMGRPAQGPIAFLAALIALNVGLISVILQRTSQYDAGRLHEQLLSAFDASMTQLHTDLGRADPVAHASIEHASKLLQQQSDHRVHGGEEAEAEGSKNTPLVCHEDCVLFEDDGKGYAVPEAALLGSLEGDAEANDLAPAGQGHRRRLKHAVMSHTSTTGSTTLSATSPTVVFCDTSSGTLTITLPTAASATATSIEARYYTIINKATSYTCTVSTSSSQSIHTNLRTTTWHDGSTYDTLYGGQSASGTAGTDTTAAFTPTSTISPYYVHTSQTLTVTTNYVQTASTCCATNVVASVSKSPTQVVTAIATSTRNALNGFNQPKVNVVASVNANNAAVISTVNSNPVSIVTGIGANPVDVSMTSWSSATIARCYGYYSRNSYYSSYCGSGSYQPTSYSYQKNNSPVVSWNNFNSPTANVVKSVSTNPTNVYEAVYAPSNRPVVSNVPTTATPVIYSISPSSTTTVLHYPTFNAPTTPVLSSLPTLASSATMTEANFAQTVTGNIAVSHGYSVRSSTVVHGTISISDKTTVTSVSSLTLQPGASITIVSDGTSAWYQIDGTWGQTT